LLYLRPREIQIPLPQVGRHRRPRRDFPPDHRRPHPAPAKGPCPMNMAADQQNVSPDGKLHLATSSQRIPELDGLRGLAIFLVIICHYVANANHKPLGFFLDHMCTVMTVGWSGVDLFFVLSGFLIGGILLESSQSPQYFRTFYLLRIHRILPIYYLWISLYFI